MHTETTDTNVSGWVAFDRDCPGCRALAARLAPALARRGLILVPLQDPGIHRILTAAGREPMAEMHLIWGDGTILGGADAWFAIAGRIPWLGPIGWLSRVPGVKPGARRIYRWIARHRYCVGGACAVPGPGEAHRRRVFFEAP